MQKHIFRKADIRGIIGVELMLHDVYPLTQAILTWFTIQDEQVQRIAVGLDGRMHSQEIYQHVSQAIVDAGYQVDFLGMCPTPVFEYALDQIPVQAGIMITGSASAAEYNGFKIYLHKNLVQSEQLEKIYQYYQAGVIPPNQNRSLAAIGKIVPCPIIDQYIDGIWKEFAHLSEYDFSIVIDCSNGATVPVIKKLIEKMNWKQVVTVSDTIDGSFANHNPEPFDLKNIDLLHKAIEVNKKTFGVGFDGDGDRMIVVDQQGQAVLSDQLSCLFLKNIVQRYPKKTIVCDAPTAQKIAQYLPKFTNPFAIIETLQESINTRMQQKQVVFGSQAHGRFFFKDRHSGYADGIYAFLRLLDVLIQEQKSLQELLMSMHSNQINLVPDNVLHTEL